MMPITELTTYAADVTAPQTPTVVSDKNRVFANGTSLYIEEVSGKTVIYYISGSSKVYLNSGNDMSGYDIFGGFEGKSYSGDTSITMKGGTVRGIYGSGHKYCLDTDYTETSGGVQNVNITMSGGTVTKGIYATSCNVVNGNVDITVTGGTVPEVYGCSATSRPTFGTGCYVYGKANLTITGGNVTTVFGGDGNYPVNGTVSGIFLVPVSIKDSTVLKNATDYFTNLFYLDGSTWTSKGNVTIPSNATLTIAQGQTLSVSGSSLKNKGTIVNNGTLNVNGTYQNDGTITNNGTLNLYASIRGNGFGGNGTVNYYAAYIEGMRSVSGISAKVDGTSYPLYSGDYILQDGRLYVWLPSGNAEVTVNGKCYYGVTEAGKQKELKEGYVGVTGISGIPGEIGANRNVALNATLTPSEGTTFTPVITYELVTGKTTAKGVTLNGNTLYAAGAGTVGVKVTVSDGYTTQSETFEITVKHIPVTGFGNEISETMIINAKLSLPKVSPSDASYQTVNWSIVSGQSETGATINNGVLTATKKGTFTLRATVEHGTAYGSTYTKDFTVEVVAIDGGSALDISAGNITISQNTDGTLKVEYSGFGGDGYKNYAATDLIVISGTTESNRVIVKSGSPNVVLSDCSITSSTIESPFEIQSGATVNLTLNGENTLKGENTDVNTNSNNAGLQVPSGAKITIGGMGTLNAEGGKLCAGIGAGGNETGGTITITGGTIVAKGGYGSAGIGCGQNSDYKKNPNKYHGGTITITGGMVTATGDGAGIGGGYSCVGGTITISGGTVIANGGSSSAGIGSGYGGNGGTVTITGGNVKASKGYKGPSDIGAGQNGSGGTLTDGNGNAVSKVTLSLNGLADATSLTGIEGSSYGVNGVSTLDTNQLYFYLPSGTNITKIATSAGDYICHKDHTYYTAHDWSNKDGVCVRCGENCTHPSNTNKVCDTCGKTLHTHSWAYTSFGEKITATCENTDGNCEQTDGGSVTLNIHDSYYGNPSGAFVTGSFTNGATYAITYDDGSTAAPTDKGAHTVTLIVSENNAEKERMVREYEISYLPAPATSYQIENGYKDADNTYWFKNGDTITVSAPEGYGIATALNGSYGASVTLSETDSKGIFLKNASGEMTDQVTIAEVLSFDKTAPTGTIKITDRGAWQELIHKISFGLFFKGDKIVNVSAEDAESGVKSVEYYLADKDLIDDANVSDTDAITKLETAVGGTWSTYSGEIPLKESAKNVVYVKITDQVGNVAYLSSEGIVLYKDAAADTETITTTYKAKADKTVSVVLNGNQIQAVANGDTTLTENTDYTVNENVITLKAAYLDTLDADEHTFTVSYAPLGLEYVEESGNDAPKTTSFTLRVEKAEGSVTNIGEIGKTYDSEAVGAPTYTSLSGGVATFEYKKQGAGDDTYTSVAPSDAGDYTVRVTVAADHNYKAASAAKNFHITKASITLTAKDAEKVYGENDPEKFDYTISSGTVYGADREQLLINIQREPGEDVKDYTITASQTEGANPNYDITFESGTFTIKKKTIGIDWGTRAFTYDGTEKRPTATATGMEFGDEIGLTVVGEQTEAGRDYIAEVTAITGEKKDNYQLPSDVTTTFVINKAGQEAPTGVNGISETIYGKEDGRITGVDDTMEYRKDDVAEYTPITGTEVTNLAAGTYYIRYKAYENHDASDDTMLTLDAGRKLTVTLPEVQKGYTLTADHTQLDWMDEVELTYELKEGYTECEDFVIKVNGTPVTAPEGKCIVTDIQSDIVVTVEGVADITAPDAEITIGTNKWNKFWNQVTFGLFFKETQTVSITATDKGSGLANIYYYLADRELTETELRNLADGKWVEYTGEIHIDPQREVIIYAKAVDKDDNIAYINSEGVVLDSISPSITGIANGETYYGDTTFTVSDKHLEMIKVDGKEVTPTDEGYTIVADGKEHTIVAVDELGNESEEIKICVLTIASINDRIEHLTTDNVKSSDKETLEEVKALVDGLISSGKAFTEEEQKELADIKAKVEMLEQALEDHKENQEKSEGAVETRDESSVMLWIVWMSMALLAMWGTMEYKKRKDYK